MVEVRQSQSTDEILQRNGKLFKEKIMSSLEEMLALSRYSRDDTLLELGLGAEVFLTLILALASKDLYLCVALLKLAETVSPLLTANQYMVHQMLETFKISPHVIQGAVQYLEKLEESRLFNILGSIGTMLRHASDIVVAGQSVSTISSNPSEAVKVSSELEEAVNDIGQAGDLPKPRDLLEIIDSFVQRGGCKSEEGDSLLHICVQNKSVDGVKVLLDFGYKVNVINNNNKTCLMLAVEIGHREIVDLLLQNGADPNISDNNSDTPLFAAASSGDLEIIRKLVDKGADLDYKNSEGFTDLYRTVKKSNRESAILLRKLGANLCPEDIMNAAKYCDVRVMELLKELGADLNLKDSIGLTPLHWALARKNEPVVRYLVEAGSDPNASNSDAWTPLHYAVYSNNEPLVRYLVEAGSDPNARSSDGWTPLHRAVDSNNEPIVRYLVEAGSDSNARSSDGWTPLHRAVGRKYEPIVRYLVEAGADPNTSTSDGWTPLHRAVFNNYEPIVRYFVEAGADPNAKDRRGWTPLTISRDPQISAYLRSKGAQM